MWLPRNKTHGQTTQTAHQLAVAQALQSMQGSISMVQTAHVDAKAAELPTVADAWGYHLQQQNLLTQALALPYLHTAQLIPGGPGVIIRGALSVIGRAFDGSSTESRFGWEFSTRDAFPTLHTLRTSVTVEIIPDFSPSMNERPDNYAHTSEKLAPRGTQFHYRVSDFASSQGMRGSRLWWAHGIEFDQPINVPPDHHALVWLVPVITHGFGPQHPAFVRLEHGAEIATGLNPIFPIIGGHAGTVGTPFIQPANGYLPELNAASAVWGHLDETARQAHETEWLNHFSTGRIYTAVSDRAIPTWVF